MTGFLGSFWGLIYFKILVLSSRNKKNLMLSQGRVQRSRVVPKVLILVPREGKNLCCPEGRPFEFLSRT